MHEQTRELAGQKITILCSKGINSYSQGILRRRKMEREKIVNQMILWPACVVIVQRGDRLRE